MKKMCMRFLSLLLAVSMIAGIVFVPGIMPIVNAVAGTSYENDFEQNADGITFGTRTEDDDGNHYMQIAASNIHTSVGITMSEAVIWALDSTYSKKENAYPNPATTENKSHMKISGMNDNLFIVLLKSIQYLLNIITWSFFYFHVNLTDVHTNQTDCK